MTRDAAMRFRVALCAQRDQVQLGIIAGLTAKLLMVNFQIRHCATRLTPPAIATRNLLSQILVRNRIQPKARKFGPIGLIKPLRSGFQEMSAAALRASI
jgi:hypothetical protein